jgi:hypothetical protein
MNVIKMCLVLTVLLIAMAGELNANVGCKEDCTEKYLLCVKAADTIAGLAKKRGLPTEVVGAIRVELRLFCKNHWHKCIDKCEMI